MESVRLLLALAAQEGWRVHHMDVKSAFLNGDLKEEVYVHQPPGFAIPGKEGKVLRLRKALYGLRQAPRAWNVKLDSTLKGMGFEQSPHEVAIYRRGRANSLKSIRLIGCAQFWDVSLARLAAKCPLLEEIECSHQRLPANFFKYVGTVCPQLKHLRIHRQWVVSDPLRRAMEMEHQYDEHGDEEKPNENAFAIAENMHELRLLQMAGNRLTDAGVYAILRGCPHLKCFDISECYNVDDELRARCAKIKHVWLPGQRPNVRYLDRRVIGGNEGEGGGLALHDLWEAEVRPLRGEAAMDGDSYVDNYWEDYWSSSYPWP
ncbi:uncharacterized protein LOC133899480 [Phragmites australis]|uniref:uncharacterized protein LOC133899480 n=1 Tax=Phragmites australis TaxID=29695 RepID=UPI002D76FBFB|nr:uncharacterized protein LOC133899480 [Phragmites australis]